MQCEDSRFKKVVKSLVKVGESARGAGAINFLPFLKYLPGDMFQAKEIKFNWGNVKDFIVEEINDMENKNCSKSDSVQCNDENFVSSYKRRQMEKTQSRKETYLDYVNMIKGAVDLFGAGTETVSNTVVWCVLCSSCIRLTFRPKSTISLTVKWVKGDNRPWRIRPAFLTLGQSLRRHSVWRTFCPWLFYTKPTKN